MRKFIVIAILLLSGTVAGAQRVLIKNIYVDGRMYYSAELGKERRKDVQCFDMLNLGVSGAFSDFCDYNFRVQFAPKFPYYVRMDFCYLNLKMTENSSITVGKYAELIGGYEFDAMPIDVYYWSAFCKSLYHGYGVGAILNYNISKSQKLAFQICESPVSPERFSAIAYNLYWNGRFAPFWKTIWSVNFMGDKSNSIMNFIALGNRWEYGCLKLDLDFINRMPLGYKNFPWNYSVVSNLAVEFKNFNICLKGGYEKNSIIYSYAGGGFEIFPWAHKYLRVHTMYYREFEQNTHIFNIGVSLKFEYKNN